ncbi:MAG: hypothetical protein H6706_00400 [Myxococcales bacterium]|nr:hypothetical protein [Myxococcales bacterium]
MQRSTIALTVLAVLAPFAAAVANPSVDGARGPDPAARATAAPPAMSVQRPEAVVDAGAAWQTVDVLAACGVRAPDAHLAIEEISGDDAAAREDVALAGPTTLRLRAAGAERVYRVDLSATDADGNQAFDRCTLRVH